MSAESQPDRENTCWAAVVTHDGCQVMAVHPETSKFMRQWPLFETEEAAVSYALEHAEHLAGYWERQTDLLRRRLHEIATREGKT